MCNQCPTVGDLFCWLFRCGHNNCKCYENKCENKCERRCEHKCDRCERCERKEKCFECVCQEKKEPVNSCPDCGCKLY
ncbi:MAG: hypothetical protein J6B20_01115 [Clostridia bacterium]|nr:hypothetical protein [Clostridia bacterium]